MLKKDILSKGGMKMRYAEITKRQARERYEEGKVVRLMASKLNPHSYWVEPLPISKIENKTFEQVCNSFIYYNCSKETGKAIKFYIVEGVD